MNGKWLKKNVYINEVSIKYVLRNRLSGCPCRWQRVDYELINKDNPRATQGRRIRKIYINSSYYSQNIYLLSSHRSHKSHRERIVTLAFAIRLKTLGNADKRGRSDAPFVRFVRFLCETQSFVRGYSGASALSV